MSDFFSEWVGGKMKIGLEKPAVNIWAGWKTGWGLYMKNFD